MREKESSLKKNENDWVRKMREKILKDGEIEGR